MLRLTAPFTFAKELNEEKTPSRGRGAWFSAIFNPRTQGTGAVARRGLGGGGAGGGGKGDGTCRIVRNPRSPSIGTGRLYENRATFVRSVDAGKSGAAPCGSRARPGAPGPRFGGTGRGTV